MAKKIDGYIKLQIPAGQANPSPPVGPALGQKGVNIMEFCKAFNADTQGVEPGLPIPVVITVYNDKSFTYIKKTPPASILLKKALGIKSGSGRPNTEKVGKVTRAQLEDIEALQSCPDDSEITTLARLCQVFILSPARLSGGGHARVFCLLSVAQRLPGSLDPWLVGNDGCTPLTSNLEPQLGIIPNEAYLRSANNLLALR